MKRGYCEVTAEILRKTIRNPNLAPTRIMASTGVNHQVLKQLLARRLVEVANTTKKRGNRLTVTDNGRLFLEHYKIIEELCPPF
ncbi:hypothetical protein MUO79_06955 [Candidatus Bathyarchaeota archaeon]|jgi:predicted transcriptional regulator|nr:hypothetical protein [Candidatus Bathyarchaeota archaeon]